MRKLTLFITLTILGLITVNCPEPKKSNNAAAIAALLAVSSTTTTISPTAGEDVCDGKRASGSPVSVTGDITANTTWSNSVKITGTVTVKNNATLTVSPGTVVFGETGSSLFVTQGSKLNAVGSVGSPICFTSAKTLGSRAPGDWGGIVLIGNAVGTRAATTEGVNKLPYGSGSNDADGSGTLNYVIVEFAGNEVAAGDELNGISSYTIGSATSFDYVQVHRGLDDGFEFWGGKPVGSHLVVTGGMDDDYDMDEGFRGTLQYLVGVKYPTACGGTVSTDPHGMEMDGVNSGGTCGLGAGCSNPTVKNYVLIGQQIANGKAARHREGMAGSFSEGIYYNFALEPICDATAGFPATNSSFSKTISDKALTNSSSCTGTVPATVTKLPITSLGAIDATNCGNGATKPDFTTIAEYSSSAAGAVDPASANWWANWTVYRSK